LDRQPNLFPPFQYAPLLCFRHALVTGFQSYVNDRM
jgi:hypothetical protein